MNTENMRKMILRRLAEAQIAIAIMSKCILEDSYMPNPYLMADLKKDLNICEVYLNALRKISEKDKAKE